MGSEAQEALLKFCAAHHELSRIEDSTAVERRRVSRNAASLREMLREQMVAANVSCVPVTVGSKQMYARMRPPAARTAAITPEAVMKVLKEMTFELSQQMPQSVEECVERALMQALTRSDEAPRSRVGTVSIAAKPLEQVDRPHPQLLSRIQETATSLGAVQATGREIRKRDEARRKELRTAQVGAEERVAADLVRHDPEHATRRVRVVAGDEEQTFILRRKTTVRHKRPTLRTALPAIRKLVRNAREASGVDATPTWQSFRWLTSPETLRKIEQQIKICLDQMNGEETKARVVLSGV